MGNGSSVVATKILREFDGLTARVLHIQPPTMPGFDVLTKQAHALADLLIYMKLLFQRCCDLAGMGASGEAATSAEKFEGIVKCAAEIMKMKDKASKKISKIVSENAAHGLSLDMPKIFAGVSEIVESVAGSTHGDQVFQALFADFGNLLRKRILRRNTLHG